MMDQIPALYLVIGLILAGLVFLWLSRQQKRQLGLPKGRIIYTDTQGWIRLQKPLFDPKLKLTGKPDYLVEHAGTITPVEVKSSRGLVAPYESHIYQLAAYCVLVDRLYRKRPGYGIIRYPDKTFAVDFTPELEEKVLSLICKMQSLVSANDLNRSHQLPQRCAHCGYQNLCDQALRI